jgi:AhpD family alkylhydroperoxidase
MITEPPRIDYASVFPVGVRTMVGLQRAVDGAGLEPLLLELVKMRASQINGCAYCLDMHSKDARALGESEQRLHLLAAWREASCYDARERAAFGLVRGPDLDLEAGRARRRLRGARADLLAGGDRRPDPRDRRHQRLEPAGDIDANAGWLIRVTPRPNRSVNHAYCTT